MRTSHRLPTPVGSRKLWPAWLLGDSSHFPHHPLSASGNHAVTEWHRTATLTSGEKQSWLSCLTCDLYTFRRGLIVMKDTYIKVVG
jgi:hypothetical protein